MGLFRRIQVTLLMLGHNLTQELLADIHAGFPNHRLTSGRGLHFLDRRGHTKAWVPDVGDLDPDRQYIIDGTLAPCWSWSKHPELYSGKHHTTRVDPRVAGHLAWISKPSVGSFHDAKTITDAYSQPSSSVV